MGENASPKVFISYSHKDEEWKDRLVTHLKALEHQGDIVLWDDRKIGTGDDWYEDIQDAMADAAIAICLISADYLASDFINKEEIPELQRRDRMNLYCSRKETRHGTHRPHTGRSGGPELGAGQGQGIGQRHLPVRPGEGDRVHRVVHPGQAQ